MNYQAPDGHIITSIAYPGEVSYTCNVQGYADGIYESIETTGSAEPVGIKQIRITRTVESGEMTIVIRESSSSELTTYVEENTVIE